MTDEEKRSQDAEVEEAWRVFHTVHEELQILDARHERLKSLLDDFTFEEWGRTRWDEEASEALRDLQESLKILGKLV